MEAAGTKAAAGGGPHAAQNAGPGRAYVLATAAARYGPAATIATATRWFAKLGLEVEELPVLTRTHANSEEIAERAAAGSFFYLGGGDPGHVAAALGGSAVWAVIRRRWEEGAVLAGSSAGAMALGEWTLIRDRFPGHVKRNYRPALAAVPRVAVCPHFETFGHKWVESALERAPVDGVVVVGIDERSAAVWDGERWTARGPGAVTVIHAGERRVSRSGEPANLPLPGTAS